MKHFFLCLSFFLILLPLTASAQYVEHTVTGTCTVGEPCELAVAMGDTDLPSTASILITDQNEYNCDPTSTHSFPGPCPFHPDVQDVGDLFGTSNCVELIDRSPSEPVMITPLVAGTGWNSTTLIFASSDCSGEIYNNLDNYQNLTFTTSTGGGGGFLTRNTGTPRTGSPVDGLSAFAAVLAAALAMIAIDAKRTKFAPAA